MSETPRERLDRLVRNSGAVDPDHVQGYLFGIDLPNGLERKWPFLVHSPHPVYSYYIPWDDQTGPRLREIAAAGLDEKIFPNLTFWCEWGADAWDAWQESKDKP